MYRQGIGKTGDENTTCAAADLRFETIPGTQYVSTFPTTMPPTPSLKLKVSLNNNAPVSIFKVESTSKQQCH